MESQPQNPEFRNNPENFHPCVQVCSVGEFYFTKYIVYVSYYMGRNMTKPVFGFSDKARL